MILNVYAIKDTKTTFWRPHTQVNEVAAIREFDNLINSNDRFVSANYADLELWFLGTFDDLTGDLISEVRFVVKGADVKKVGDSDG